MEFNKELTVQQNETCMKLRKMKMSGMADSYAKQAKNPNQELRSFDERFMEIVEYEYSLRYNKKYERFLKRATLKYPAADFDQSIYDPDRLLDTDTIERLATCDWITEGKNLIITGATGAGKSYIASALCVSALHQFKTVKYIRANTLMNELEQARIKSTFLDYINTMAKYDLLVIDDFGLMELDLDKCRDLFEVIETRESRKSMIIVSQLPVASWYQLFADNTYADACLDRIVHKAFRLEFKGRNMRKGS